MAWLPSLEPQLSVKSEGDPCLWAVWRFWEAAAPGTWEGAQEMVIPFLLSSGRSCVIGPSLLGT